MAVLSLNPKIYNVKKEEVKLIIIQVSADGQEAINMKLYKNGTTCRIGAGGLPSLGIGIISFVNDARYFDPLLESVPQEALHQPIHREEKTPNGYLEYVIAFYGVSRNGDTGERADWSKSTGIRVKVDHQSTFNHPIMKLLDGLTAYAAELTNELYFDAIMLTKWKAKSSTLLEQTIITQPPSDEEIHRDYEYYVSQMLQNPRQWDLSSYTQEKTYERDGLLFEATVRQGPQTFGIDFKPCDIHGIQVTELKEESVSGKEPKEPVVEKKKPWWRW